MKRIISALRLMIPGIILGMTPGMLFSCGGALEPRAPVPTGTRGDGEPVPVQAAPTVEDNGLDDVLIDTIDMEERPLAPLDVRALQWTPRSEGSVVLVVIDALNRGHLPMYGYNRQTSPHLAGLAQQGVVFNNWVSNSSWTRPSFTTILTGVSKPVHQMELGDNSLRVETLAEQFKQAGYQTAAVIGNPLIQAKWGYDKGFDHFVDTGTLGDFPPARIVVDAALDWLSVQGDKPVFLVAFITDPHAPYAPLPISRHFSEGSLENSLASPVKEMTAPLDAAAVRRMENAYDDEIRQVDQEVGRLLGALKSVPQGEGVTLAVMADHGEIFGGHNCFQHAWHQWEHVLRTPMILVSPALQNAVGTVERLGTHVDVMPLLLGAAGLPVPKFAEGINPLVQETSGRMVVSAYDAKGVRRVTAYGGDYKLICHKKVKARQYLAIAGEDAATGKFPSLWHKDDVCWLFNWRDDNAEATDLLTRYPAEAKKLRAAIRRYERRLAPPKKKRSPGHPTAAPLDPELKEALEAAGYLR